MRKVICISGPINAGKSTVARRLAVILDNARYVEGDRQGIDDVALNPLRAEEALQRIERRILWLRYDYAVLAFPLRARDHARLMLACHRKETDLLTVTLCPPMDVVLDTRGDREIRDYEQRRIIEMYNEGYAASFQRPIYRQHKLQRQAKCAENCRTGLGGAFLAPILSSYSIDRIFRHAQHKHPLIDVWEADR